MSIQATALNVGYVKTIGIVNNGYNGRGFANPYDTAIGQDGRLQHRRLAVAHGYWILS